LVWFEHRWDESFRLESIITLASDALYIQPPTLALYDAVVHLDATTDPRAKTT
jgi:hypothetical protein